MEHVREERITLYIDTNKRTIEREYHSVRELIDDLRELEDNGLAVALADAGDEDDNE